MAPADQRFRAAYAIGGNIDFRLIVELELTFLDRVSKLAFESQIVIRSAAHFRRIESISAATRFLRVAHRCRRTAQQQIECFAIERERADADAHGGMHFDA